MDDKTRNLLWKLRAPNRRVFFRRKVRAFLRKMYPPFVYSGIYFAFISIFVLTGTASPIMYGWCIVAFVIGLI